MAQLGEANIFKLLASYTSKPPIVRFDCPCVLFYNSCFVLCTSPRYLLKVKSLTT